MRKHQGSDIVVLSDRILAGLLLNKMVTWHIAQKTGLCKSRHKQT